jgi:23S rRNA pseudouridine955/2504/2580 synthase
MKEFFIGRNDAGQRLDRFTSKAAPLLPNSLIQKYIRTKRIKVNGKPAPRDYRLVLDDVVSMYVNDEYFGDSKLDMIIDEKSNINLDIIYEDENILLVNKQAGILCHSDTSENSDTLVTAIQAYLLKKGEWNPREETSFAPALCNRIDRNTSGIVIAAKNAQSLRIINEKLKLREIDKMYLTIVHGLPNPPQGRIESFWSKDRSKNQAVISKNSGEGKKIAMTEYTTLATEKKLSLLVCRLITGRSHQIRSQLAEKGTPILGDIKYGGEPRNRAFKERVQLLCSYKVVFLFKTDADSLSYLNGKSFEVKDIPFVIKYFPDYY